MRRPARPEPAPPLFAALSSPECYPHPVGRVRVIETHISWVLLTGTYAYKLKKPVNLGFVDFTTTGMRRHYCEEEVRLNQRLAPGLYLGVVPIRGSALAPHIGGEGPIIDYAVKMREFPQGALASRSAEAGAFGAREIDALAATIADFHASAAASPGGRLGSYETVRAAAVQNFEQMRERTRLEADTAMLVALRAWTENELAARRPAFAARKSGGYIRECHGDLHLGNIAMLEGRPVPFDCIEFNDELRWIDTVSEVAFLVMDLEDRGCGALAWRFLNRYLEATGDYAGLSVLRFYLVYRAMVRAKVHLIRSQQPRLLRTVRARLARAYRGYLRLAERLAAAPQASLTIAHGMSGSGKTTATQSLIEQLGAVRLRSDLERKRVHGIAPLAASGSATGGGIYTPAATAKIYQRLGELAHGVLAAGYPVVVDATFLRRPEREAMRAVAESLDVPFRILNFQAPLDALRARVAGRRARSDDASEADVAVLEHQIAAREPLTPAEMAVAIPVDGTGSVSDEFWRSIIERRLKVSGRARRARPGGNPSSRLPPP